MADRPPYAHIVLEWLERSSGADSSSPITASAASRCHSRHHHHKSGRGGGGGMATVQINNISTTEALLCDYCACFVKERTVRCGNGSILNAPTSRALYQGHDGEEEEQEERPPHGSTDGAELCGKKYGASVIRVKAGRKHGMHMAVEHVLSGGSLPAPSRPHFLRCLAILEQPNHPFLTIRDGELRDRLCSRKFIRNEEDCVVRWLFEGRQHVFSDPILAKNMRRWINEERHLFSPADSPFHYYQYYYYYYNHSVRDAPAAHSGNADEDDEDDSDTEAEEESRPKRKRGRERRKEALMPGGVCFNGYATFLRDLPNPCRLCVGRSLPPKSAACALSYAGVLTFGKESAHGHTMESKLQQIEREAAETALEAGIVLFCLKCHRVAAISYEYDQALRNYFGLSKSVVVDSDNAEEEVEEDSRDTKGEQHACPKAYEDAYYARQITLFHKRRKLAPALDDFLLRAHRS